MVERPPPLAACRQRPKRRRQRWRHRTSWLASGAAAGAGGGPEPLPFVVGASTFCCSCDPLPCRLSAPSRGSRRAAPRGWKAEDGAVALISLGPDQRHGGSAEGVGWLGRRCGAWFRGALSLSVEMGSKWAEVSVELNARRGELGGYQSPPARMRCAGGAAGGGDFPLQRPAAAAPCGSPNCCEAAILDGAYV